MMQRLAKKLDFNNLIFVIKLLWRAGPAYHLITIVLLIFQSVVPLVNLYQIKLIFDIVAHANTSLYAQAFSKVSWQVGGIIGLSIFNSFLVSAGGLIKTKHSQIISEAILLKLHKKSIQVDLEYYENPEYYDTFYRVQTDTPTRIFSTFSQLQSILQSLISLAAMVGMLMLLHWSTGIILLLSIIPGILVQFKFSKKNYQWQQKRTAYQREGYYYSWLLTANNSAKELRTFNLGELFRKRYKLIREKLFSEGFKITKQNTLWSLGTKVIEVTSVYGLFLFLIVRSLKGFLSIGDLVIYYQIFTRGQSNISSLLNGISSLFIDNLFFKNLIRFLNYKTIVNNPEQAIPFPEKIQKVDFKNICFKYPDHDKLVLNNITMQIKAGDKVAVVGKNGSGKTSFIKVLCRLYNPLSGSISINGIDYKNFKVEDLRENISVLFQDYVNYQIKANENIRLGDISLSAEDDKIKASALYSGANEFIEELPHKYDTILGKMFEDGEELSMGQWQKIALSRILVSDAPIIILDEPSSSMDAEAERKVFEQIAEITKDKILILISHRLSTIKSANCIYFLEDGEIIEHGSHKYLMELNGKYAKLFNLQSNKYVLQ